MPAMQVWKAGQVVFCKRSMASGYGAPYATTLPPCSVAQSGVDARTVARAYKRSMRLPLRLPLRPIDPADCTFSADGEALKLHTMSLVRLSNDTHNTD